MEFGIILRTVFVYVFIILAIRLFGKREIAQLSITDLVLILLISNSVQSAMVGGDTSLWGGIVAAITLFVVNYVFDFLFFKSKTIASIFQGHPLMLVYHGKTVADNMRKAKISEEELEAVIHEHGIEFVKDVDLAILEIDGNISVLSENFKHQSVRKRRAHKVVEKTE